MHPVSHFEVLDRRTNSQLSRKKTLNGAVLDMQRRMKAGCAASSMQLVLIFKNGDRHNVPVAL